MFEYYPLVLTYLTPEDELTMGLRKIFYGGRVHFWIVIALSVILDSHDLLGRPLAVNAVRNLITTF